MITTKLIYQSLFLLIVAKPVLSIMQKLGIVVFTKGIKNNKKRFALLLICSIIGFTFFALIYSMMIERTSVIQ